MNKVEETAEDLPTHDHNGVDLTLIRHMLSLTPAERLDALQNFMEPVQELRARNPQL